MEQQPPVTPGDEWMPERDGPEPGGAHPAAGNAARAESNAGSTAGEAADRLSVLTHELGGLLDGSLRWLTMVSRSLGNNDEAERVRGQLGTVRASLVRMGELVRTASGTKGPRFGFGGFGPGPSVAEAASHAVDVVRPRAAELGVTIGLEISPGAATSPAGPLYSVLLNGLRNAIESIEQALGGQPGEGAISMRLRDEAVDGGTVVVIEINDDGLGPPADDAGRVFEPGFSTRGEAGAGRGIGLALSKQIVDELGGSIELRAGDGSGRRRGAALIVRTPALSSETANGSIGEGDA